MDALKIQALAMDVFQALDTPISLSCAVLLRYGDMEQLVRKTVCPDEYICPDKFRRDAQAVGLLKKVEWPNEADPDELKRKALANFYSCEKACYSTNLRLRQLQYPLYGDRETALEGAALRLLWRARKILKGVLGKAPSLSDVEGRFGPGATYQHSSLESSILHKLAAVPEVTERISHECISSGLGETAWFRYLAGDPLFDPCDDDGTIDLPVVPGNRWTSVPKDSTKRRSIAIEPTVNLWLQLGVGSLLKRRLARHGLLLTPRPLKGLLPPFDSLEVGTVGMDSSEHHKLWAREGSLTDLLATIDLSNASDMICIELVRLLLPEDWFNLLWMLRSPYSEMPDGTRVLLEKFSSMGCGFTFELETAIFYSLATAVVGSHGFVSTFGDDIIVPSHKARDVIALLRFCGFAINAEKSFVSGPFRESCGGDYFLGEDVRPVQIKELPVTPVDCVALHNMLYRIHQRYPIKRALNTVRGWVPQWVRQCGGSVEDGDGVFHGQPPKIRWKKLVKRTREGRAFEKVTEQLFSPEQMRILPTPSRIRLDRVDEVAQVVAVLYGVPLEGCPVREIDGYRKGWVTNFRLA